MARIEPRYPYPQTRQERRGPRPDRNFGLMKCRIQAHHRTFEQMASVVADDNMGAFAVLVAMAQVAAQFPDSLGPFGPVLDLDRMGIWGEDIHILHAKIAGADSQKIDVFKTLCLLKAVNRGILSEQDLKRAIAEYKKSRTVTLDVDAIVARVLAEDERLRAFRATHPA